MTIFSDDELDADEDYLSGGCFDAEEVITFLCKLWNRSWAFLIVQSSLAIFSAVISVSTSSSGNKGLRRSDVEKVAIVEIGEGVN